jgi:hypothetical protein
MFFCYLCSGNVESFDPHFRRTQKRAHIFVCPGCGDTAFVCNSCRKNRWSSLSRNKICCQCGNRGYCFSVPSIYHKSIQDLLIESRRWSESLKLFFKIRLPKVQHILLSMCNFNKFIKKHRFLTISYAYSSIGCFLPVERRNLESIQKMFWGNMIRNMIQSRFSFSYQWIALTKGIFFLAKNFSLSKLLICRLFGESMPTSFLTARMTSKKSIQQLMSNILHRLLSNNYELSGL